MRDGDGDGGCDVLCLLCGLRTWGVRKPHLPIHSHVLDQSIRFVYYRYLLIEARDPFAGKGGGHFLANFVFFPFPFLLFSSGFTLSRDWENLLA